LHRREQEVLSFVRSALAAPSVEPDERASGSL
jgi:hypothetical protein